MKYRIAPLAKRYIAGFHAVLDSVAREREYLSSFSPTFFRISFNERNPLDRQPDETVSREIGRSGERESFLFHFKPSRATAVAAGLAGYIATKSQGISGSSSVFTSSWD